MTNLKIDDVKIIIEKNIQDIIPSYMQTKLTDNERGGILMGMIYPDSNTIVITEIFESKKAKSSRYNVEIDKKEMQQIIDHVHNETTGIVSYLGDWHTHPEPVPRPSSTDIDTFQNRINKSKLSKNVLINMIIGNNINENYLYIKVFEKY